MARNKKQIYPDFTSYIAEIQDNGISVLLLQKIIQKHRENALYNKKLYDRYMAVAGGVPIFERDAHYQKKNEINNKINNAFFSEIVDFKTGYFVGKPIGYGYGKGEEAEEVTGGSEAVDIATKTITDFVVRNNMYGVDMEVVKFASIYGYAGRLFYIDLDGNERVMPIHGYETIILSHTDISEPEYAIRYFCTTDIDNNTVWTVEFYDSANVYIFEGGSLSNLKQKEIRPHMFDSCPLQGVANNRELLGDAEKVLALIDDYDKVLSDNSNEIESFVHAMLVVTLLGDKKGIAEELKKANDNGILHITPTGTTQVSEPVKWLTKQINDTFNEHHLERVENNIYRFSNTPNLSDESFGSASGVSLKFKLHGLETKCGMCQAQMMNAAQYMWRLLSGVWAKKRIVVDPLQVIMSFERNFPLDHLSNAQAAQAMIAAGVPEEVAWDICIPEIDDIDYVKELKEQETDVTSLYENVQTQNDLLENEPTAEETLDDELDGAKTGGAKINLLNGAQIQALTGIVQSYNKGDLSRNAAITLAVSSLGISRENAEAIIEEKIG